MPLEEFLQWKINDKMRIGDILQITDEFLEEEYAGERYIYHWSSTLAPLGVPSTIEYRQNIAPMDTILTFQDVTYIINTLI